MNETSGINNIYFGGPFGKVVEKDGFVKTIGFGGVVFLNNDPVRFKKQLYPQFERFQNPDKLFDGVSTDHIITVAHLLTDDLVELGDRALCGLGEEYGIENGTLRRSGGTVLVAGKDFGKGSSREQAVWALLKAGFSCVLAESFGPLFEKNAHHLGLLTSTNTRLAAQIQNGEPVSLEEFLRGKDLLYRSIIQAGGLFNYLNRINSGKYAEPMIGKEGMPLHQMNIYQKRLARAFNAATVKTGECGLLPVDVAYSYVGLSGLARAAMVTAYNCVKRVLPADRVYFFEDHFAHSTREQIPLLTGNQRSFARELGVPAENYYPGKLSDGGGSGICHRVMLDKLDSRNQQVVIATDSHTPTLGVLPIIAIPVGSTLFAAGLAEGRIPYSVAPVMRVEFTGSLPPGFSIRDVQLELTATFKPKQSGMVVEYGGGGLNTLNLDQVAALCNMVPEIFVSEVAVTEAFEAGVKFLVDKFGMTEDEAINLYGKPDPNCEYEQVVHFDLSKVSPWVARPGSPGNAVSLAVIQEFPDLNKAFLVSCTLGLGDLIEAAAVLKGKKVSPKTQLIIIPSSRDIREKAARIGVIDMLKEAGSQVLDEIACGPCIGEGLGAVVDGEVAITASNRNYHGRMGSKNAKVYMGGAILTTLSSLLGRLPTVEEYHLEMPRIIENLKKLRSN
ncbi:hypothetical protein A3A46_04025 [Candidatus Roizmanbacteria bacterium RIFCSPLOWO2_01_FULL_37_13]|uniref:Uncharacterized protein n=1 Tax=Candidatus Roizmanbacteria bacterium RIFCSPHIGHO2_02_FULL_38_11 TaxID=1802039 RepID=A0A1F7H127_9BACT|nr:MAG: hypothetical protein A3C25_03415 [Candidatus Roizmanbacteria bacterium RIFCSPHIGHO2_02_FULL_38_11]OGK40945.1 MAG: hypothetical protein A3A46_04025 [Candidatus Roizmanbacteria bacterium RIFCSPLOWO2_01_FULL_37_13]